MVEESGGQEPGGQDAETLQPPAKKSKTEKGSKTGPGAKTRSKEVVSGSSDAVYTPKEYSAKRCEFIRELKDGGMSHFDANQKWNESSLKKELLSTLSVGELIRRRFVPKGTENNP